MGKAKKPARKDWPAEARGRGREEVRRPRVIPHTDFACRSLICFVESSVHGGLAKGEENVIVCSLSSSLHIPFTRL